MLTFESSDHFHPGSWIDFHQGIGNKYHMHAVEHTLQVKGKKNSYLFKNYTLYHYFYLPLHLLPVMLTYIHTNQIIQRQCKIFLV